IGALSFPIFVITTWKQILALTQRRLTPMKLCMGDLEPRLIYMTAGCCFRKIESAAAALNLAQNQRLEARRHGISTRWHFGSFFRRGSATRRVLESEALRQKVHVPNVSCRTNIDRIISSSKHRLDQSGSSHETLNGEITVARKSGGASCDGSHCIFKP